MTHIASKISANSDVFKSNRAGMVELLQRVQEYQQRTVAKSAQARARFEKREQLLPRERLSLLLDHGAPFIELSALAGSRARQSRSRKKRSRRGGRGRHRNRLRRPVHDQRFRFRHRRRRPSAHGSRQTTARPGARARKQAAVCPTCGERGREPDGLSGRGVHPRREPVSQPRAHVRGGAAGHHRHPRLVDRGRRLPDRSVRLHRHGPQPHPRLSRRAAAAESRDRRGGDGGTARRRRNAYVDLGSGRLSRRRRPRRHSHRA